MIKRYDKMYCENCGMEREVEYEGVMHLGIQWRCKECDSIILDKWENTNL